MNNMDNKKKDMPYDFTHAEFWGGRQIPQWLMLLVTAFPLTGFFGVDHWLLHSPGTGVLKALVNIFTLGLWYFYDIIQSFRDGDYVDKYGRSLPFFGAAGIGYGAVGSTEKVGPTTQSPLSVVFLALFAMTIFLPFGLSSFIAGDTSGGVVKVVSTFVPILWPFLIFWSVYEAFKTFTAPKSIFTEGLPHSIPFNFVIGPNGLASRIMNPASVEAFQAEAASAAEEGGFFSWIFGWFTGAMKMILDATGISALIFQTKCQVVEPAIQQAQAAVGAAQELAAVAQKATVEVPAAVGSQLKKLQALTNREELARLAAASGALPSVPALPLPSAPVLPKMSGGGGSSSELDPLLLGGISILVLGGFALAYVRNNQKTATHSKDDKPNQRNDTPPQPRSL